MFLARITNWLAARNRPSVPRRPSALGLRMEALEARDVPALFGFSAITSLPQTISHQVAAAVQSVSLAAPNYNQQIIAFCQSHRGTQVGGGECAHLATEALRVVGAEFNGGNNGYNPVWGTAVTTLTKGRDSNPSARCQPGDIIQFQHVTLTNGWTTGTDPGIHTAVVAAVDSRGRPTQVYEQNVGVNGKGPGYHDRTVRLDALALSGSAVASGTITIYRAVPRVDHPGQYQFTLNNATNAQVTVQLRGGTSNIGSSFALSKNNTPQVGAKPVPCYVTEWASSSNGSALSLNLVVNGKPLSLVGGGTIQNGGGYEIATVGGQLVLRRV